MKVPTDLSGGNTVDVRLQQVAVEGHGAVDAGAVRRGGQERSTDEEVEVTTGAQVMDLSGVELGLNTLTGSQGLEGILSHLTGLDLEANTIEGNLVGCACDVVSLCAQTSKGEPVVFPMTEVDIAVCCS